MMKNNEKVSEKLVPIKNGVLDLDLQLRGATTSDEISVSATGGINFNLMITVSRTRDIILIIRIR